MLICQHVPKKNYLHNNDVSLRNFIVLSVRLLLHFIVSKPAVAHGARPGQLESSTPHWEWSCRLITEFSSQCSLFITFPAARGREYALCLPFSVSVWLIITWSYTIWTFLFVLFVAARAAVLQQATFSSVKTDILHVQHDRCE